MFQSDIKEKSYNTMCLLFFVRYANIFIFSDVCFFDILFAAVGQYFVQILRKITIC